MILKNIIPASIVCLFITATFTACDKKTTSEKDIDQGGRSGDKLTDVPLKYYDAKPSISADGEKIAFISGRDHADESSLIFFRAYKSNFAIGAEPSELLRVTDGTAGSEISVEISPNGSKYAVIVADSDKKQTDLYLYGSDTAGEKVTDSAAVPQGVEFSPDSALVAWTEYSRAEGSSVINSSVFVADVSDLTNSYQFQDDSKHTEFMFWLSTGTGYKLVYSRPNIEDGGNDLISLSFSVASTFTNASVDTWSSHFSYDSKLGGTASASSVFFSQKPLGDPIDVGAIGDLEEDDNVRTRVRTLPAFVSLDGTSQTQVASPLSHQLVTISASRSENLGVVVARERHQCQEGASEYGNSMYLIGDDGKTQNWIHPVLSEAGELLSGTSKYCEMGLADDVIGAVDSRIQSAIINANAVSGNFRIVFVSKSRGDTEIRVYDITGSDISAGNFIDLSKNFEE